MSALQLAMLARKANWLAQHYPTFTQVPPNRAPSITMALTPNLELAIRAEASPPLPPPMTRKSVSFEMGAMVGREVDKCRDRPDSRMMLLWRRSRLGVGTECLHGHGNKATKTGGGGVGGVRLLSIPGA